MQITTQVAPVTSLSLVSITASSLTFTFIPSAGATSYTYAVIPQGTSTVVSSGNLITQSGGAGLLATVSHLQATTGYIVTIYVSSETFGSFFTGATAPLPATSFTGKRNDNSSVILSWVSSPGTTQLSLTVSFASNGSFVTSSNFPVTSSTVVYDLADGVMYQFTLYSGNFDGIDLSQGATTQASTYSMCLLLLLFSFSVLLSLYVVPSPPVLTSLALV